ncbi:pyridoxal-phosphate dependent enzyme [Microscilla marina]|uniref:Serine racemase n=1 Tax=Microscilla marina ATCC 23134 TaxID=313606 RepID=A1ZHE9_MICM2|nr:pyridoxal-phosphate dependent enzyme [Microscilla marina]EAY30418.1 serine racemase [Microscilla marina ATCC 23134]
MLDRIPTLEDIQDCAQRIQSIIHHTPVLTCGNLDEVSGAQIFFKCENFQKIGAFKMRGASSAGTLLNDEARQKGLATHSSGNHGQAVALTAKMLGVPAYIVMPENAPSVKKNAVKGYGAQVIECESTAAGRQNMLDKVVVNTGAHFISPYNDYGVIAGQATAVVELLEEVPGLEIMITPLGGGGLMAGAALACHYLQPSIEVIGGEPKNADDGYRSFRSGKIEPLATEVTIADGLRSPLGDKTFGIIKEYVNDVVTVTEEEIIHAMRLIWERMKLVIEPSCAVPFAVVLQQPERFKDKKIGIILTGGNVDLTRLPF